MFCIRILCKSPQNDELCRLPLLRTHFHAVNPLLSDTIELILDHFSDQKILFPTNLLLAGHSWALDILGTDIEVMSIFCNNMMYHVAHQWAAMHYIGMVVS